MMAVLFVLLLLPGPPGLAMAEERGPVELLKDRHDTVLAIVEQDPDVLEDTVRLRAIAYEHLLPHVDFMTLSRWVMGKYWRTASPEQRRAFADEFRDLLLNNYLRSVGPDHRVYPGARYGEKDQGGRSWAGRPAWRAAGARQLPYAQDLRSVVDL
jgi:hypothetical protein